MSVERSEAGPGPLLTPELMRQLDRLDVLSRKLLAGRMQGERRSPVKGQSVEFADYRNYVVGDDLRFIDWNLYARLNRLFLRLFMEEQDLSVTLAVDVTASMGFGEPEKLLYAKRLAAAIGYIALTHHNRVNLAAFTHRLVDQLPALRGRQPIPRMLGFLERQAAREGVDEAGDLATACRRLAMLQQRPGVVVLISDFLEKGDLDSALRWLVRRNWDVYAIQVLSPQEMDPAGAGVTGDLKLWDVEDGETAEVSVTAPLLKRYKANLDAHFEQVQRACVKRGIAYMRCETEMPVEDVILKYLRHRGLVG